MIVPLFRYLDTVGDGSGTKNAIGNYSAGEQIFKFTNPVSAQCVVITTFIAHIAGPTNFALTGYANIAGGLTNGWTMHTTMGGVTTQFLDGEPIKTNDDLAHFSPKINHLNFNGAGDSLICPLESSQFGMVLTLHGGDTFQVILHDDFSTLTSQHFIIQGYTNT